MKPSLLPSIAGLVAGLVLLICASSAFARDHSGVNWSISVGTPPPVVYGYESGYGPPPVVYVQPHPVYVAPPPVVVYRAPGYETYGQPYAYGHARRHGNFRHHDQHFNRHHHGHGHDGRR